MSEKKHLIDFASCGGCSAKLASKDLAQVLQTLPETHDERLLVGHETFDDAGVYYLNPEQALVQTVDFFPPNYNDPVWFGRVAAANSISDVYAMGGVPVTALSIVGFPSSELPLEALTGILKGAQEKVAECGAVLVGGHTIRDPELKFGLSVTGLVHPARVTSNAGAKPGDVLFLTKPLGMGPVTTAYRKSAIAEEHMLRAIQQMATLNKSAAEAMSAVGINEAHGIHAATDVTGIGLVGHARNIARASKVTLSFRADALPLFEGAREFAAQGLNSGAMKTNEALLAEQIEIAAGLNEGLRRVIFDAETSGGLLIAVASQSKERLARELSKRGVACIAEVGHVEAQGPKLLTVR